MEIMREVFVGFLNGLILGFISICLFILFKDLRGK